MRSWADVFCAVVLATGGCTDARPAWARADAGHRTVDIPAGDRRTIAVAITLDPALVAPGNRPTITPVGPARGRYLLVIDSYASRPQGLSRCQAGRERWARLIDLAARREIYHRLVESCLTNVEPNDPPVRWDADGRGLTLDLLSPAPVHVRIAPDGCVTER